MIRQFDLFEKFSDGSSRWRICVLGEEKAMLKLKEMSAMSSSEFYGIGIFSGEKLSLASSPRDELLLEDAVS